MDLRKTAARWPDRGDRMRRAGWRPRRWPTASSSSRCLIYRTGPYAPNGIPIANGMNDYFNLINQRDGGVGGVKLTLEECETAYNNDRGVECYERLKDRGADRRRVVNPYSTGITYALIERATADKIPILSMGYGRTDGSRRPRVPLRLHRADDLLEPGVRADQVHRRAGRRHREPARARSSRWSTTTAPTARSRSRPSRSWPGPTATSCRCSRSPIRGSSRRRPGSRSAASCGPTGCSCGAGA